MRTLLLCTLLGWLTLPAIAAPDVRDPYQPQPYVQVRHPDWAKHAVLYEINTRQFTPEGTFRAAEAQLPRLKALGVDLLWLMPVNPIGVEHRKGTMGSPYSVRDYYGVNPEFGTLDDLKHFLATAHALGFHVILDWVANHTAWDNPLAQAHPDWYLHNAEGQFEPPPWFDWYDVISLDYRQPGLRRYMTDAMKYWVRDVGFDGFRCDVAGFVPLDFWENVRRELDAIRPVFMLGEWESRDLQARAFDATYAWSWYDGMHSIAMGKADAGSIYGYYAWNEGFYPRDSFRMLFTSNQDKNSWDGTAIEQFGAALPAATVLSFVSEGVPLIYNGQEAGNTKRLKFFEKDPIEWRADPAAELYRRLIVLHKTHPALWSAHWGARMVQVPNDANALCFVREQGADKVFAVFNLSPDTKTVKFTGGPFAGAYHDYFTGEAVAIKPDTALTLQPWACRVFVP